MADPKRGVAKSKYGGITMYWGVRLLSEAERSERMRQAEAGERPGGDAPQGGPIRPMGDGEDAPAASDAVPVPGEDREDASNVDPWSDGEVSW
ncbi:MAG: hypothetical protein IPF99_31750 [Deltaproteobacteria bacterium]|nr:hypothetical protein [Deltaproteobacteria bacterium]